MKRSLCKRKMSKEKLWYLVVGSHFSHRHFLNPCLMSFPSYKFCKFPLEQYRVCFMKMSSASAAITHTPAIMCTMQNGSNSGENESQQSSLWNWEQSHFLSFAINTTIKALITRQVSSLPAERLIIIQLSFKSVLYWWTAKKGEKKEKRGSQLHPTRKEMGTKWSDDWQGGGGYHGGSKYIFRWRTKAGWKDKGEGETWNESINTLCIQIWLVLKFEIYFNWYVRHYKKKHFSAFTIRRGNPLISDYGFRYKTWLVIVKATTALRKLTCQLR